MSNIVAFAGAKQSGKTTSVNFLHGHEMKSHGFIKKFFVDEGGRLVVNAKYLDDNDKEFESMGVFDIFQDSQTFADYAASTFWPFVRAYNFADPLKRMCVGLFGLTHEQCYGTDEEKNSLTDILWDNVSHDGQRGSDRNGYMTAREFMQFFGTNICRKIKTIYGFLSALTRSKIKTPTWHSLATADSKMKLTLFMKLAVGLFTLLEIQKPQMDMIAKKLLNTKNTMIVLLIIQILV